MIHPAAKFAVNQRVMVAAPAASEYQSYDSLIVESKYALNEVNRAINGDTSMYTGWLYMLDDGSNLWALQSFLRPRPEPSAMSWDELKRDLIIHPDDISNPYEQAGGPVNAVSPEIQSLQRMCDRLDELLYKTRDISGNE